MPLPVQWRWSELLDGAHPSQQSHLSVERRMRFRLTRKDEIELLT